MVDYTTNTTLLILLAVAAVHFACGWLADYIWTSFATHEIDKEERRAIRILWFAFLPLGLSMVLFFWLNEQWNPQQPDEDWLL